MSIKYRPQNVARGLDICLAWILFIMVWNVVWIGKTRKTTFQEEVNNSNKKNILDLKK